jgi:biotin operon repressor
MSYPALAWAVEQDTASTHAYAVLCALAGFANENGECWPSQKRLAEKTKQSDRSVRNQIQSLIETGHIIKCEVGGRDGYRLSIHNDRNHIPVERNHVPVVEEPKAEPLSGQPEPYSQKAEPLSGPSEPVRTSHESVREKNTKKVSRETKPILERPPDVSESVWSDFITLRKAKRAPVNATAMEIIRREADKVGWPVEQALRECCARGWQGFKASWVQREDSHGNTGKTTAHERKRAALDAAERQLLAGIGEG